MNYKIKPIASLKFLAVVYRGLMALRNRAYSSRVFYSYQSSLPVISVGNLTAGGSGKSPFCDYLAEHLVNRRPAILSRGYGGKTPKAVTVHPESSVFEVGDEALMHLQNLNQRCAVVVAKDRVEGVKLIEQENLAEVIILDDGFQHRRLRRNVDIVLADISSAESVTAWEAGAVLPAGYFRENKNSALSRTDILVFVNKGMDTREAVKIVEEQKQKLIRYIEPRRVFLAQMQAVCFRAVQSGEVLPLEYFSGQEVRALSAIAKPENFSQLLKNLGLIIQSEQYFPDHYIFKKCDWDKNLEILQAMSLPLIVTSKDAVKLRSFLKNNTADVQLYELVIKISFLAPDEENSFWQLMPV
ncbi:MAG: tetraacyldisaccharide 4'-kinase [Deltaproteobacteria bacterium]|jgi:tetraacyldisaccharide 4'-kinase|nr:tetraacyldisaccharide 4'-kinase [Deltaproteobacteria bacterium]